MTYHKTRIRMPFRNSRFLSLLLVALLIAVQPGCRSAKVNRAVRKAEHMQKKAYKKERKVYKAMVKRHHRIQSKKTKKMMRQQKRESSKRNTTGKEKKGIFHWLGF